MPNNLTETERRFLSQFTFAQRCLLARVKRCPDTGYFLRLKGEIRMAAVLEHAGAIEVRDGIAHAKKEKN